MEVESLLFLDPGLFFERVAEAFVDEARLGMEETEEETVGVDDEVKRTVLHKLPEADFFGSNKACAVKVVKNSTSNHLKTRNSSI